MIIHPHYQVQEVTSCLEDHTSHDGLLCRAPTLLQLLHPDYFSPRLPAGGAREAEDTDSRPGGSGPSGKARPEVSVLTHTESSQWRSKAFPHTFECDCSTVILIADKPRALFTHCFLQVVFVVRFQVKSLIAFIYTWQ